MTTKTENLEAWEALQLLMLGERLFDSFNCDWSFNTKDASRDERMLIERLIQSAPFRLAKVEAQSVEDKLQQEPHVVGRALWIQLCKFHESNFMANINEVRDAIVDLIRSEARKIAQEECEEMRVEITTKHFDMRSSLTLEGVMHRVAREEIAKLKKEFSYGTVTISKEAIEAAKRDPGFYEPGVIGLTVGEGVIPLTVGKVKGQDRGEPNE